MENVIGVDLGTNSIGWAIRDLNTLEDNQIIDYGAVVFTKGVGDGKSGEFSLAAERRTNRGKRRLYNAKRYRKWALLNVLIENNMCPLSIEELRLWSIGKWQKESGINKMKGRIYPINNVSFQQWLAFDPIIFGNKGFSSSGNEIRKNPYDLRFELLNSNEEILNKDYFIGRALYHMVQRRGFKTNRKSGKSKYAENKDIEKLKLENSNFHISTLAKEIIDKGERFRAKGVIQRRYFEEEFFAICNKQNLSKELIDKLYEAIYFVRPLRSQKGLVGNCTLEKSKTRIPISHPRYEEFRALSFVNNLKWRKKDTKSFDKIPLSLKKQILENLFFRKYTSGKNKGKVNTDSYFKFDEITSKFSEGGNYEFNFPKNSNVSTCPTIAALMNVFDEEWKDKFIIEDNKFGINWGGLGLKYKTIYVSKKENGIGLKRKGKGYTIKKINEEKSLNVDDIWHLLYDYLLTKDKQEALEKFSEDVIGLSSEKSKELASIDILQGYGSLSYSAISKITPILQYGYIYSEAVLFANLKKVLGSKYESEKDRAREIIAKTITEIEDVKEKLNIVNGLIQKYFSENYFNNRAKGVDSHIKEMAYQETIDKLEGYFGKSIWESKIDSIKEKYIQVIFELYLKFLDGKQEKSEMACSDINKISEIDYYKIPRLDKRIKEELKKAYNLEDKNLNALYHPSDIQMYPLSKTEINTRIDDFEVKVKILESPQPPSKGWKNPMAMRTLHELRHLFNYLLKVGKVDFKTKVVVEMARELNDSNKRWAIQTYQKNRENENKEFAKAIIGVAKEKYSSLNERDIQNINKVRLWWEQLENNEEIYNQIKLLKEDVQKYRLWAEQGSICMYTGEVISLVDLFDGTQTHFEHTFPRSISFDNSLSNLTVCKAYYNTKVKNNSIPTKLENYYKDTKQYTAIEPRLIKWQEKVNKLKIRIDENRVTAKKIKDPIAKSELVRNRHLMQLEYDYWYAKLSTFTLEEIPEKWKNSQLVDTQIISKYARAYLKTVFQKVEVQKGSVVNEFKKIYQVKGDEQKDRSKHSHHAIDAAILTLIPGSARREGILKDYYEAKESSKDFYNTPYSSFHYNHILDIEKNIIINHINRDKTLFQTVKPISKGRKNIKWIAKGDTIRGQLHKDTFFGAVKPVERNEKGYPIKENGKYKTIKNPKTEEDEIWIVSRKLITQLKTDKGIIKDVLVDELLKQHIQKQLNRSVEIDNLKDFNNQTIRHVRTRVKTGIGYLSKEKAIPIKNHVYPSQNLHKREVLTQNEENYLFLLYEGKNEEGKVIRHYRILNLFDIAQLRIKSINELKVEPEFKTIQKGKEVLNLKIILKKGAKVIFYKESKEELKNININSRLYKLYSFNEMGTPYLNFQNILEARPDNELGKGEVELLLDKYQPRLALKINKLSCLYEWVDFKIMPDGEVIFF